MEQIIEWLSICDKLSSYNHIWVLLIYLLRGVAAWNRGPWILLLVCLLNLLLFLLHSCNLSSVVARWPHGVSSCLIGSWLLVSSCPKKERKEKGYSHCHYKYFFNELLGLLKYLILLRSEIERVSISLLSLKWLISLLIITDVHFVCKLDIEAFLIILLPWMFIRKYVLRLFNLIKLFSIGWIDRRIIYVL